MLRRQRKKSRFETDAAFREHFEECWPEHFRRVSEHRRAAPFVRFYYPLLGFFFSAVLAGGLTLAVAVVARQEFLWKENATPTMQWLRTFLEQALPVMWVSAAIVVVLTVVACIGAGMGRARTLLFEAEKLEMGARQEHALWLFRCGTRESDPFETLAPVAGRKGAVEVRAPSEVAPQSRAPGASSSTESRTTEDKKADDLEVDIHS